VIDELADRLAGMDSTVAQIARELLARCRELTVRINQLEGDLRDLVRVLAPGLLAIPGWGVLSAATSSGKPPAPAGSAPAMPSPFQRDRADPGVVGQQRAGAAQPWRQPHRQLGVAHDRRHPGPRRGPGQAYVERLLGAGKTRTEALRLLRRRLSDVVFRVLLADEQRQAEPVPASTPQAA
jgi:transposase